MDTFIPWKPFELTIGHESSVNMFAGDPSIRWIYDELDFFLTNMMESNK